MASSKFMVVYLCSCRSQSSPCSLTYGSSIWLLIIRSLCFTVNYQTQVANLFTHTAHNTAIIILFLVTLLHHHTQHSKCFCRVLQFCFSLYSLFLNNAVFIHGLAVSFVIICLDRSFHIFLFLLLFHDIHSPFRFHI